MRYFYVEITILVKMRAKLLKNLEICKFFCIFVGFF